MTKTAANVLIERLLSWGVEKIFRPPGDCVNSFFEVMYTVEHPAVTDANFRQALAHPGPAVVQAVVDQTEPPMPGKIATQQARHFAEALARGQQDSWGTLKTLAKNTIREVL